MFPQCTKIVQGVWSGALPLRPVLTFDATDGPHYTQLSATLCPCKLSVNVISCKARGDLQTAWIQATHKMPKVSGAAWRSEGSHEGAAWVWALFLLPWGIRTPITDRDLMALEARVFKHSVLSWRSSLRLKHHNTQRGLYVCGAEVNWSNSNWSSSDERRYGMQENASCYNRIENINNPPEDRCCHSRLSPRIMQISSIKRSFLSPY